MQALNELDKQANKPTKASAVNRYGSAKAEKAIMEAKIAAIIGTSASFNYNSEGFALVVVRKAANGSGEVLFDAAMDDKDIMKGVREGYKAMVAKAEAAEKAKTQKAAAETTEVEKMAA